MRSIYKTTYLLFFAVSLQACGESNTDPLMPSEGDAQLTTQQHAPGTVSQDFLTLSDGTQLYYTLTLPEGDGPFPVIFMYDPYDAGVLSDPTWNEAGYAMLGVNFRGTGCSEGHFYPLSTDVWGRDGAEVVEWAARQEWSSGDIGMIGISFTAVAQYATAAFAGPALKAIAPGNVFLDFYRDFIYPGGMRNLWVPLWVTAGRGYLVGQASVEQIFTDPERCGPSHVQHTPTNALEIVEPIIYPWVDHPTWSNQPSAYLDQVNLPVLACVNWQDTTIYSRSLNDIIASLDSDLTWIVGTNGTHYDCPITRKEKLRFFDYYLKGVDTEWPSTPHVVIVNELENSLGEDVDELLDSPPGAWQTSFTKLSDLDAALETLTLYLHSDGSLQTNTPGNSAGSSSFFDAPTTANTPADFAGIDSFGNPRIEGSSISFTTPVLEEDLSLFGPAAAELWLSTIGFDADIQVLLSEVRPDGQEVYVQNGWLRWSHRVEDETQSLERRPYHQHAESSESLLLPGEIVKGRIEIYPFAHVFRAGTALRLTIDTPAGWFEQRPLGVLINVHHDDEYRSAIKLGWLRGQKAEAPIPDCGVLLNQPCRPDSDGMPQGSLKLP